MKRTLNMTGIVAIGLTASGTLAEEFPGTAGRKLVAEAIQPTYQCLLQPNR